MNRETGPIRRRSSQRLRILPARYVPLDDERRERAISGSRLTETSFKLTNPFSREKTAPGTAESRENGERGSGPAGEVCESGSQPVGMVGLGNGFREAEAPFGSPVRCVEHEVDVLAINPFGSGGGGVGAAPEHSRRGEKIVGGGSR